MSEKWADFLIDAVRFNSQHTHIDLVRCRTDRGETISESTEQFSRQQVIAKIGAGIKFCTIYRGDNGKWKRGASVIIIILDGEEFIKTVSDKIKKDNLDNLPEF